MSYYRRFPKLYNQLAICVDSYDNASMEGRAYFGGEHEPTLFRDVCPILIKYNRFLNYLNVPQAATELRTFYPERKKEQWQLIKREGLVLEKQPAERKNGEKATFVVHVEYRQNSTWQGNVTWIEQGETKNFRSALELMVMMESALSQEETADFDLVDEAQQGCLLTQKRFFRDQALYGSIFKFFIREIEMQFVRKMFS